MIRFPNFKRLELSDRDTLQQFTARHPPYSDFEFASLYSWSDDILWSVYKDTLVVRFSDYADDRLFFSFLDDGRIAGELAPKLLALAAECGYGAALELVPEAAALSLGESLSVQECPDHADYLYDLAAHREMAGRQLRGLRQEIARFERACPNARTLVLDLDNYETRRSLHSLWGAWARRRGGDVPNETRAFERFLSAHSAFDLCPIGLVAGDTLVGMDILVLLPDGAVSSLFQKADLDCPGVTAYLAREAARLLLPRGYSVFNAQQDLGIPALRRAKRNYKPCGYLRKYRVSLTMAGRPSPATLLERANP